MTVVCIIRHNNNFKVFNSDRWFLFLGVLIIMIVQSLSLIFLSLLGLHVYRNGQIPRVHLLFFNSLLFLLIAILISINWTVPESSVMIFQSELALTAGHGAHLVENWCCDMNGYKEICSPEVPGRTVPSQGIVFKSGCSCQI